MGKAQTHEPKAAGAAPRKGSGTRKGAKKAAPRKAAQAKGKGAPSIVPRLHSEAEIRLQPLLDDAAARHAAEEALLVKWARRGARLLRSLAAHGARDHEYRVDLREGRFVWIGPEGRVSVEARAQVLCSYTQATSSLTMAWADPLLRSAGVPRIDGVPSERDDLDEEAAWRVAMLAADACGAEYLYRVAAPHAWYFLALRDLSFQPARASFTPGTPVGMVLQGIEETRQAILSRAEPAAVVRERLSRTGSALLHEADYAYRGTDWVARLSRAGKRLLQLADQVPRLSFDSVAKGTEAGEWLPQALGEEISHALTLLEDEWLLFA